MIDIERKMLKPLVDYLRLRVAKRDQAAVALYQELLESVLEQVMASIPDSGQQISVEEITDSIETFRIVKDSEPQEGEK
jgi:hypothetical protein